MKQILYLFVLLVCSSAGAQEFSITFRLQEDEAMYLKQRAVFRNNIAIGETDAEGYITVSALHPGDTLILFVAEYPPYRYIVPETAPVSPVTARVRTVIILDEKVEYPGGIGAMKEFIRANMHYPERAIQQAIEGKSWVKFVVDTEGTISNITVSKGIPDCPECDAEAVRLVGMMPKWTPGKDNGKAVKSYTTIPVIFKLE